MHMQSESAAIRNKTKQENYVYINKYKPESVAGDAAARADAGGK
jgi:hypothetical protein